jgi:hypothetical protein
VLSAYFDYTNQKHSQIKCKPLSRSHLHSFTTYSLIGSHVVLLTSYRAQRRLIMMYKWDAQQAFGLIKKYAVSAFVGPAAMTGDLLLVFEEKKEVPKGFVSLGGGWLLRPPSIVLHTFELL